MQTTENNERKFENAVIMDFTKSQLMPETSHDVYQFPVEIGKMLLTLYKESLQHTSFDNIKRNLINDIREQNDSVALNHLLFEFMQKREFIDNVVNNTLEMYQTEWTDISSITERIHLAELPTNNDCVPAVPTGKDDEDYQPKKVGTIKNLDKYNRE